MEDRLDAWEDIIGSGVRKKIIVEGEGDCPQLGSLVLFNWKGTSLKHGQTWFPFAERVGMTARIGDGDEVPGLEVALRHMRVGQECLLHCESRFAYGEDGCPATKAGDMDLPPGADVELRVVLVKVLSDKSVSDMTPEEVVAEGKRKKEAGNHHFARGSHKRALRSYTGAHNTVAGMNLAGQNDAVTRDALQLQIDCGNNVANACIRLGELEKAKEAAVGVLELDSNNAKALFRAGQVSSLQSNFVEAKLALRKAFDLNPASREVQVELRLLTSRVESYHKSKRAMQEKMGRSLFARVRGNGSPQSDDLSLVTGNPGKPDPSVGSGGEGEFTSDGKEARVRATYGLGTCEAALALVIFVLSAFAAIHFQSR